MSKLYLVIKNGEEYKICIVKAFLEKSSIEGGGCMDYPASVVQVIPDENYTVYTYFNDGSVRKADIKSIIAKGDIFARLADECLFRECLTVMNGVVAWDVTGTRDAVQCIDLAPCTMYADSPVVTDPLQTT